MSWEAEGGAWHSSVLGIELRPQPRYLAMRDADGEEIGLPVDNGARARAAERGLREAREEARRETAARFAAEEELRQLRARIAVQDTRDAEGG